VGPRLILLGAFGLAISLAGLLLDIGFIAQPFYAYAWWSYIFMLDGFVAWRRGSSLLTTRRRHLPSILLWSVTFWYFFEVLNLRYQNWYYVGVLGVGSVGDALSGALFGAAAFATVFMGLFETYEVLVWGSLTFLVDPWNYRRGARSILADFERGHLGVVVRLLAAGFLCGLVWESFNFLAPQKWIYTVRGLEELKLFEMPVLGFLGFPALALDAFAAYAALAYLFHANATWEHPDDVSQRLEPRTPLSRRAFAAMLPLHLVFWGVVGLLAMTTNVGSLQLELEHLETLPPGGAVTLESEDIRRPRHLLRALEEPGRRDRIRESLELTENGMKELYEEIRLLTHKGIGHHHGAHLRQLGYRRVEDIRGADVDALYTELDAARAGARFPALRPSMVRVWVLAAETKP
jgi:hypothetical protein